LTFVLIENMLGDVVLEFLDLHVWASERSTILVQASNSPHYWFRSSCRSSEEFQFWAKINLTQFWAKSNLTQTRKFRLNNNSKNLILPTLPALVQTRTLSWRENTFIS